MGSLFFVLEEDGFEIFKGHGEPVVEVGCGEDAGIEVAVTHETDVFEAGLKVGIGHGARVLEFSQTLVGEEIEVAIRDEGFEGTATVIGFVVLRVREPAEEVLRTVVERIIDEVMTVTEIGFSFAIDEDFSFTVENLAHKDVAGLVTFPTICWGSSVASTDGFRSPCRGVIMH